MKQSELDSMSLDELFMLHELLTATLEARITAERKALEDRLRTIGSSKARDQSAMMQPGRANVGAAMIAHGAEHTRL